MKLSAVPVSLAFVAATIVSAAQIADLFHIPFLGIRVVSNNITNDGAYDGKTAAACQEYVSEVVKAYVKRLGQVSTP